MSDFWRGFIALPIFCLFLALCLAVLVFTWWLVSDKFLEDRFWREQDPIIGDRTGHTIHMPIDQAALHLLARWAWGVKLAPGVRIALYISGRQPTDTEWDAAQESLDRVRDARQFDEGSDEA